MKEVIAIFIILLMAGCTKSIEQSPTQPVTPKETNTLSGTCPRGLVNDPAPGVCALYVDNNNNAVCDRSEQ